jgi:hypothetical protein
MKTQNIISASILATLIILGIVAVCLAADVKFAWDKSPEADMASYRLYQSQTSGSYVYGVASPNYKATITHPTITYTLTGVAEGLHYWVLTAVDTSANESVPSNEVSKNVDTTPPGKPLNFTLPVIAP